MDNLNEYLDFLREAERLKSVERTAWTATGRRESTAEHSWRLALLAALFARDEPALDRERALLLCLVHDLGELYDGDVSAALRVDAAQKHADERASVGRVCARLPADAGREVRALWEEYDRGETPEAKFVKALDKAETILQHNQGRNPPDFDYAFNLEYGAPYFADNARLAALRAALDAETRARIQAQKETETIKESNQ